MKEIIIPPFGTTIINSEICIDRGEGVKVIPNGKGIYLVYSYKDGMIHEQYEYENNIISSKKKLFERARNDKYVIYMVSNKIIEQKGFVVKDTLDKQYHEVPIDINITYDLAIKINESRVKNLIEFIMNNNMVLPIRQKTLLASLEGNISSIVKAIIGSNLDKFNKSIVENNVLKLSKEIMDTLNSPIGKLYDIGLVVDNFYFNVNESYEYKTEKRRIKMNKALNNELGGKNVL